MITSDQIQGHWVRDWIKAPGFEDHTTRVHWMQAGLIYADVRIPSGRPDLNGAKCIADLPALKLSQLAEAEGFAGHTTLKDVTCTWHRAVNWHGEPSGQDIGEICFDEAGRLVEKGVLAEYTELWVQSAKSSTRAIRFSQNGLLGVLVLAGEIGVLGIGPTAKPATDPVLQALKGGTIPDQIETLFDGIHAVCRLNESGQLTATLATNPFAEGQPILSILGDEVIWHKIGFDGTQTDICMQRDTLIG